jgi:hypothetical protein
MSSLRTLPLGAFAGALLIAGNIGAQRPTIGPNVRPYVKVDTAIVALTHARVIDGTGAPARANQTLIIRDGKIAALGNDGAVQIPAGALTIDLTGKTLIPGIVGLHEHLLYPVGPVRAYTGESFLAAVPRRRRDHRSEPPARTTGSPKFDSAATSKPGGNPAVDRRDSAVPRRQRSADVGARAHGTRGRGEVRELLGRRRRQVVQGLHHDLTRASSRRRSRRRTSAVSS